MNSYTPSADGAGAGAGPGAWHRTGIARIPRSNKTRQGYARKRILKPAGYSFVRRIFTAQELAGGRVVATVKRPFDKPAGLAAQCQAGLRKLYNALVVLLHCVDVITLQHHWRARLKDLISRHAVPVAAMDFPARWEQLAIRQEDTP